MFCFFLGQALQLESLGKVTEFTAVPGCGLKCTVSHIESLIEGHTVDFSKFTGSQRSQKVLVDCLVLEGEGLIALEDVEGEL